MYSTSTVVGEELLPDWENILNLKYRFARVINKLQGQLNMQNRK
jgi:hypothetical protein